MNPIPRRVRILHLLALALPALALPLAGTACAGEQEEGEGAQYPQPGAGADPQVAPSTVPGEAPTPITVTPAPPPPPPAQPAPQEIVPGSTTEEEYEARAASPEYAGDEGGYADNDPSALTDFRQALDPYGSWVDDPNYGTVWTPSPTVVGDDFEPYVSAGSWTYDDYQNWVWVSDYEWGWAPFHYGRWAYLGSRWGWIPGREYAGAWVSWRTGYGAWDNYLGWAPIPPTWGWRNGVSFGLGFAPSSPYAFCNSQNVFGPGLGGHLVTGAGQVAAVGASSRPYASPTVGASGRVIATPTVGPPPSTVGIAPNAVSHTPLNNRGIVHAQQFSRPASAQALGAHAASPTVLSRGYSPGAARSVLGSVYSRNEPIARGPQYQGIAPRPYYPARSLGAAARQGSPGFASRSLGTLPSYAGYGSHYGSTYSAGRYASPSAGVYGGYRGPTTVHSSGGHAPSSFEDAPHRSSGSSFGGGGGFRGGGGGHIGGGGGGGRGGGHR